MASSRLPLHVCAIQPIKQHICERDRVPLLTYPRGKCVPFTPLAGQLMQRSSEYVRRNVAVEHYLDRDRSTGQFIAKSQPEHTAATARPHILTMMNRLFDSPPPMPALGTTQCGVTKGQTSSTWSTNCTTSVSQCTRFDRDHWPHFASDFIHYEHMVLAAHAWTRIRARTVAPPPA